MDHSEGFDNVRSSEESGNDMGLADIDNNGGDNNSTMDNNNSMNKSGIQDQQTSGGVSQRTDAEEQSVSRTEVLSNVINVRGEEVVQSEMDDKQDDDKTNIDNPVTHKSHNGVEVRSNEVPEDDGKVILRKNNKVLSFADVLEAPSNDDYRYMKYLDTSSCNRSRRKIEIGSEKMISDADLRLAATLVHDAMEGRTAEIKTEPKFVRSYSLYKSWPLTYLLYIAIIVNLSLVLFEEPAVPNLALHYSITMPIEFLCLGYFIVRTCHHLHWRSATMFFRDMKNIFIIVILLVTLVDMLTYVILRQLYPEGRHVRYSRVLRAVVIVNFSDGRQIRRAWRNMRRTIKEIVHVVVLFYFFIFVFALIAYEIFALRTDITYPDGRPYFKNYMDSVWDLYVLVTTSNNPDVMIPAVDKSRFYYLFFFTYVLICYYMLLNVFLAVAYHSYNQNMKDEICRSSRDKKKKLGQAFDVIKIIHNGEDMVTYRTWKRLMNLAKPNLSKNQIDLLMLILDMNRSGHIGRREFMNVADLLNVPVSEVDDRTTWLEKHFHTLYTSTPSEYLKAFVDSVFYKFIFDLVVVIEVFLIAFAVKGIAVPFCACYTLEIVLKFYTIGPVRFFKRFGNWFDFLITVMTVAFLLVGMNVPDDYGSRLREVTMAVKIIRIFRILRLLMHIQRFKIITDTLINISLSILMYAGILFIIFYVFAVVGMEVFQGRIKFYGYNISENTTDQSKLYCGAPQLNGSLFSESKYCSLNFNDIMSATFVLSAVLFENNWHILTEGYVLVTNKAARVYFAVFFMCVSVVVMNIVTAFVVDMFMYEYTIQKEGKVDSTVEKKIKQLGLGIDAETGLDISAPLSDTEMQELLKEQDIEAPVQHPWIEKSTLKGLRNAEIRFSRFSTYVHKRRKSSVPTLSRFDGIRFHIKKRGWTKIEVLLQQLYDVESDIDVTADFKDKTEDHKAKAFIM